MSQFGRQTIIRSSSVLSSFCFSSSIYTLRFLSLSLPYLLITLPNLVSLTWPSYCCLLLRVEAPLLLHSLNLMYPEAVCRGRERTCRLSPLLEQRSMKSETFTSVRGKTKNNNETKKIYILNIFFLY